MSRRHDIAITCDGPNHHTDCNTPAIVAETVRLALRDAKNAGWTTTRRNRRLVNLCPEHSPKRAGGPQ